MKRLHLCHTYRVGLCTLLLLLSGLIPQAQVIDFGKSYINITKGNGGGTLETGDTVEIRAAFVVRSGTFDSCAFFDTIPSGTAYVPGTVRVLTNEGKVYKQFTDARTDDEGWITDGQHVGIHLGFNQAAAPATWSRRGRVVNTHRPVFAGTCILIASYRVRVTEPLNRFIYTGRGICTYRTNGTNFTHRFPDNRVFVYTNYGMCSNSVGANALGTEFNGTFGSGKDRNRTLSANVPAGYTYAPFTSGSPQDYYYGIPNNTSIRTGYTTTNSWPKPDNTKRVFGVWDIIGDHTGAADPALGNSAADTVANPNAGYMLVINAAYRIDSAFQQTISNLCPNTYYEISMWMRNICSRCGSDSTGRGAGSTGYIPTATGDSSGVYPNLTLEIDGTDYYTTGNITYTGRWVKKGFVFRTGPAQTAFTLKIFNNAPGGGGNDWALDDISVATCSPNLAFTPDNDPMFCKNNMVQLGSTVRSFFDNYSEYKWERSTNNGVSWTGLPVSGTATPVLSNGAWEYHVSYPPFVAAKTDSGHKYRMVVATTAGNLGNPQCAFYGNTAVLTLHIENCTVLANHFLEFRGFSERRYNTLQWTIASGEAPRHFVVEKSIGNQWLAIATVLFDDRNTLQWKEPALDAKALYRVVMVLQDGSEVASDIVALSNTTLRTFTLHCNNPFSGSLKTTLNCVQAGWVQLSLSDMGGRTVWQQNRYLEKGLHNQSFNLEHLPDGMYLLQAESGSTILRQKLVKQNAP